METLERILAGHEFFKGLDRYLPLLTGCATNVRFNADAYLFREGEAADRFFLIREGRVALEVSVPDRGPVVVQTLGPGEVLGWSWLFPPYQWHLDARAVEPVHAFALDGVCIRGKCEQDHELGFELMRRFSHVLVSRLQATRLQLLDVYGDVGTH